MNNSDRKYKLFKKADLVIIFFILILALVITLFPKNKSNQLFAEIYKDNRLIENIDLNSITAPVEIELENNLKVKILADNKKIRFLESDCPDKVCVNTGWLTNPGELAACLPARIYIKLSGKAREGSPDAITY